MEASTHSHVLRLPNSNVSSRIRSKRTKSRTGEDRGNETYSRDDDVTGCTVLGRLSADAEPGLSRATLSRRLPPAPTRGRQSLRVLVPHCRRSWSNGRAQMNGHLYGAHDGARSDKMQRGVRASNRIARGFLPSRRVPARLLLISFSVPLSFWAWPRDLKVSARGSG